MLTVVLADHPIHQALSLWCKLGDCAASTHIIAPTQMLKLYIIYCS